MSINYEALAQASRLLLEAELKPLQGDRFQPTGFADLGPARYTLPNGTKMLLVESAQSVANRMELACWDEGKNEIISSLKKLPYLEVVTDTKEFLTSSILEAHRLNSPYITQAKQGEEYFEQVLKREIKVNKKKPVNRRAFHDSLLKWDPLSIIHGVFLEKLDGRLRVTRALSGFIEARNVAEAESGGVKINRIEPGLKGGVGNVVYPRTEFTAEEIKIFFCLDLALLRGYGFDKEKTDLLIAVSLLKIRSFLESHLDLRTACKFELKNGEESISIKSPQNFRLPNEEALKKECEDMLKKINWGGKQELTWRQEERPISISIPAGLTVELLDDYASFASIKGAKEKSLEISSIEGLDISEFVESLPANEEFRKQVQRELEALRIPFYDEEVKPKVSKKHKEKVKVEKPAKGKAGVIIIYDKQELESQEIALMLFPDDADWQAQIVDRFQ